MRNSSYYLLIFSLLVFGCKSISLTEVEQRYLLKDSNSNKYYLVNLIRTNQTNGKLGVAPALYIDNSFTADSFKKLEEIQIKKSDIRSIDILEIEKSVKLYGARGKDGFIRIMTVGTKKPLP